MDIKTFFSYLVLFVILAFCNYTLRLSFIGLFVRKQKFSCSSCGKCCQYLVKVREPEIIQLEKTGKNREDFVEKRGTVSFLRRKADGYCTFFKFKKNGIGECTAYKYRPEICRTFPEIQVLGKKSWDSRCPEITIPKSVYLLGLGVCIIIFVLIVVL